MRTTVRAIVCAALSAVVLCSSTGGASGAAPRTTGELHIDGLSSLRPGVMSVYLYWYCKVEGTASAKVQGTVRIDNTWEGQTNSGIAVFEATCDGERGDASVTVEPYNDQRGISFLGPSKVTAELGDRAITATANFKGRTLSSGFFIGV